MADNKYLGWSTRIFCNRGMDMLNCSCEFYFILYLQSDTKISTNAMEQYCELMIILYSFKIIIY